MSKKTQIGTPSRRQYLVTNSDWLTGSEGIETENTQALHFSSDNKDPNLLIQGRINNNSWITLEQEKEDINHILVNVSKWERVRFGSTAIGQNIRVIQYEPSIYDGDVSTKQNNRDLLITIENQEILSNIHSELKKLNTYMQIITGEKI